MDEKFYITIILVGLGLVAASLKVVRRDRAPRYLLAVGIVLMTFALLVVAWRFRPWDPLNQVSVHLGPLFWQTPDRRKVGVDDIRSSDAASFDVNVSLENRSSSLVDASVWVDKMYMNGQNPDSGVPSLKDETNIWLALGHFDYIQLPPRQTRTITIGSDTLSGSRLSDILSGRMAFVFDGVWVVKNGKHKPRFLPFCGYFSGGNALHRCRE
jgi:hypothetical protein